MNEELKPAFDLSLLASSRLDEAEKGLIPQNGDHVRSALLKPVLASGGRVGVQLILDVAAALRKKGEWVEVTFYLEAKVFGKAAKNCLKYTGKGRPVLLTGDLDIEEYHLKLGGELMYYDEEKKRPVMMKSPVVLTDDVQFLKG